MANIKAARILRDTFRAGAEAQGMQKLTKPTVRAKFHRGGAGGVVFFLQFDGNDGKRYYTEIDLNIIRKWKVDIATIKKGVTISGSEIGLSQPDSTNPLPRSRLVAT